MNTFAQNVISLNYASFSYQKQLTEQLGTASLTSLVEAAEESHPSGPSPQEEVGDPTQMVHGVNTEGERTAIEPNSLPHPTQAYLFICFCDQYVICRCGLQNSRLKQERGPPTAFVGCNVLINIGFLKRGESGLHGESGLGRRRQCRKNIRLIRSQQQVPQGHIKHRSSLKRRHR